MKKLRDGPLLPGLHPIQNQRKGSKPSADESEQRYLRYNAIDFWLKPKAIQTIH